jgi:hypothetical protein
MNYDEITDRELYQRGPRNLLQRENASAEVTLARVDPKIVSGVWGFSYTRFGGPGKKTPIADAQACDLRPNPGGSIVGDSWGNASVFSRWS